MTTAAPRKFPLVPVLIGVGVVALITTVLLTMGGEDPDGGTGIEYGTPTITGSALPEAGSSPDLALGMPIPEVSGTTFDGSAVTISHDGRAKILIFLAHWCPHCQAEVPVVVGWLDAGGLPDNVDLIAVATSTTDTRPNFPPSAWLEREGFEAPTLLDDETYSVGSAFGLNAFPFWVFVAPDGTVAGRTSGELDVTTITEVAAALSAMTAAG